LPIISAVLDILLDFLKRRHNYEKDNEVFGAGDGYPAALRGIDCLRPADDL
jgi:hypothetical protein